MQYTTTNIEPAELEGALPSLITKLRELQQDFSFEERVVFEEIIQSAAHHTLSVQAHVEGNPDIYLYAKPKSVQATTSMKAKYLQLPKYLGIEE